MFVSIVLEHCCVRTRCVRTIKLFHLLTGFELSLVVAINFFVQQMHFISFYFGKAFM